MINTPSPFPHCIQTGNYVANCANRIKAVFLAMTSFALLSLSSFAHSGEARHTDHGSNIELQNGVRIHRHGPSEAYMDHVRRLAHQQTERAKAQLHTLQQQRRAQIRTAEQKQAQKNAYNEGYQDGVQAAKPRLRTRNRHRYGRRYTTYLYGTQFGSHPRRHYARSRWTRGH